MVKVARSVRNISDNVIAIGGLVKRNLYPHPLFYIWNEGRGAQPVCCWLNLNRVIEWEFFGFSGMVPPPFPDDGRDQSHGPPVDGMVHAAFPDLLRGYFLGDSSQNGQGMV